MNDGKVYSSLAFFDLQIEDATRQLISPKNEDPIDQSDQSGTASGFESRSI